MYKGRTQVERRQVGFSNSQNHLVFSINILKVSKITYNGKEKQIRYDLENRFEINETKGQDTEYKLNVNKKINLIFVLIRPVIQDLYSLTLNIWVNWQGYTSTE